MSQGVQGRVASSAADRLGDSRQFAFGRVKGFRKSAFFPPLWRSPERFWGRAFFYRVSRADASDPGEPLRGGGAVPPVQRRAPGGPGKFWGPGGLPRPPPCRVPPPPPLSPAKGPGAGRRCGGGMPELNRCLHLGHCRFSALPSWGPPPPRKGVSRSPAPPCPRVPVPAPAGPCALPGG